ncbi:MAG: hypothetical protein ACI9QD_000345 [Thermoproteota archaeon]|jgi:hypothetical protein
MKKMVFLLLSVAFSLSAQASYFATHCSNATGSVKWRTGHNANTVDIMTFGSDQKLETLSLREVKISEDEKLTISENTKRGRCSISMISTYVAKVKLTNIEGSQRVRDIFQAHSGKDQVETKVICKYEMNSRARCEDI